MAELTATIEVRGLDALDAMLRALPQEIAGPILRDALAAAGEVVRAAAAANIHSRSGKTAADLRVQVQVHPEDASGVAAIGGTRAGPTARGYVLRFLEFGARGKRHGGRGWDIKGGTSDKRLAAKAVRALRRTGQGAAAAALRRGLRTGDITARRALKLPGNVFRTAVHHPGYAAQSPLTIALAESGSRALEVFKTTLWNRLAAAVDRRRVAGG
jgi:hypothetical protein